MAGRCEHRDHRGRRCTLPTGVHALHSYTRGPRQFGRKALREMDALDAARTIVRARNGGACESWHAEACGRDDEHRGVHVHHIEPNDRDDGVHDPERMLLLCEKAHDWVHRHPREAAEIGLLRLRAA